MLSYDLRELRCPQQVMRKALPLAVIAVAFAYSIVTVGAASLVGSGVLVQQKENVLAVAGAKAAGFVGLITVTVAACASAASAINATLFSVARLARSAAENQLLPPICARSNRYECPYWSIIILGGASAALAIFSSLETLIQAASLAFLLLFCFVNTLAFLENEHRRAMPLVGALSAAAATLVLGVRLARSDPWTLAGFALASLLLTLGYCAARAWKRHARARAATSGPIS